MQPESPSAVAGLLVEWADHKHPSLDTQDKYSAVVAVHCVAAALVEEAVDIVLEVAVVDGPDQEVAW